jgi:hypothetical protein
MIYGIFHKGSGLGNQLFRYVATRVTALDKGYDFSMVNPEGFKGASFLRLNMGKQNKDVRLDFHIEEPSGKVIPHTELALWEEKKVIENGIDIRGYDPEINFLEDNVVIDGEFQDERYWKHREEEVRKWIRPQAPLEYLDYFTKWDLCVIGFRGGEFTAIPELFLTKDYWDDAIAEMRKINPNMRFEVHTDDPITAQKMFPDFPVVHDIARNWCAIYSAKYLIISNSSFYILPSLLNAHARKIIAPRYWARRNLGVWALPQNYYKQFTYI